MATLLLTAVGTVIGGPLGGALGAIAGRSIDGAIIGGGRREGPRLKELAVTTSSYGQPIPRHHGRMRAGGTIVWATDLVEHKDKSGGKKGQPSVTSYAYTTSFAVALSSRPIRGVGRIWADGNLLRGAAGDLKVAGILRIHTGGGDQAPDPLIAAAQGAACPAFRDCAYAVFEDLSLGDFGNRIPALSFEIIADDRTIALADLVDPLGADASASSLLGPLAGFALEGGPLAQTLATIDTLFPLACDAGGARLTIAASADLAGTQPLTLPQAARAWAEEDFGRDDGERRDREAGDGDRPDAVRYYDVARDFQPGVQRPAGRPDPGRGRTIEFPGALAADDARSLTESAVRRSGWSRERMQWRVAELDPSLAPGSEVRVPGRPGIWRVEGWEWRSRGVELELVRRNPLALVAAVGDSGNLPIPSDPIPGPTRLAAFESPAASLDASEGTLFAAATSAEAGWAGAALYLERAGELVSIGSTGRSRATMGKLAAPLAASPGLHLEARATLLVDLSAAEGGFAPTTIAGMAQGANRMWVAGEVLQFLDAAEITPGTWRLTSLCEGAAGPNLRRLAGTWQGPRSSCSTMRSSRSIPQLYLRTLRPLSLRSVR